MNRSIQVKALGSEARMSIMRLLANPLENFADQWSADPVEQGVCMTLIADALGVAQPTASRHLEILKQAGFITVSCRHLEILKQAGFITVSKRHKWSYCKRNEAAIQEYLKWLQEELASPRRI